MFAIIIEWHFTLHMNMLLFGLFSPFGGYDEVLCGIHRQTGNNPFYFIQVKY